MSAYSHERSLTATLEGLVLNHSGPLALPRRRNPINLGLPRFNRFGAAWVAALPGAAAGFRERPLSPPEAAGSEERPTGDPVTLGGWTRKIFSSLRITA